MGEKGRRVTLGGLSQATLNARESAEVLPSASQAKPSRKSIGGPARAPARASSEAGGGASGQRPSSGAPSAGPQRRSSAHAHVGRREPRPLHDKVFQEACSRKVVAFLVQRGYTRQVSQRMLAGPPKEEFLHMMEFLQKQVDPNAPSLGKQKMEDDVQLLFKRLRYPFNVSKSSLQAPGSPHTWPHLLAAMAWLVEVLTYDDAADASRTGTREQVGSSMHLFGHVSESYYHFLSGDDAKCQELDEQLRSDFHSRDKRTRSEVDHLSSETERLRNQVESLSAAESRSSSAQAQLDDSQQSLERSRESLYRSKDSRDKEQKRSRDAQRRLKELERELSSARERNDTLRKRVEQQGVSAADVERMQEQRGNLAKLIESSDARRERAEKNAGDSEVEVENNIVALEKSVATYHKLAQDLELVPLNARRARGGVGRESVEADAEMHSAEEGGRRARGVQFGISLNTRSSDPTEILGVDIHGCVKPALVSLHQESQRRARQSGDEAMSLESEVQERELNLQERRRARDEAERAVSDVESKYKAEKDRIDSEMEQLSSEAKQLEQSVEHVRSSGQMSTQEGAKRLERAQRDVNELRKRLESEKSEKQQWVLSTLDAAMVCKQRIQQQLQAAYDAASSAHSEIADQDASSSP